MTKPDVAAIEAARRAMNTTTTWSRPDSPSIDISAMLKAAYAADAGLAALVAENERLRVWDGARDKLMAEILGAKRELTTQVAALRQALSDLYEEVQEIRTVAPLTQMSATVDRVEAMARAALAATAPREGA